MARVRNKGKKLNCCAGDYVVFDLETTGISCERDEIIEISALRVRNHKEEAVFSTLVRPKGRIPAAATAVNGITNQMVAQSPELGEVMTAFAAFIGTDILVGHNIHNFDMNFVYDAALRELGLEIQNDYVDTLALARKCLPELAHHRLTDVAAHFHIATEGAHRALQDCRMNQQCFEAMVQRMQEMEKENPSPAQTAPGMAVCPSCGGELKKRNGKFGPFWGCGNFPACRFTRKA